MYKAGVRLYPNRPAPQFDWNLGLDSKLMGMLQKQDVMIYIDKEIDDGHIVFLKVLSHLGVGYVSLAFFDPDVVKGIRE